MSAQLDAANKRIEDQQCAIDLFAFARRRTGGEAMTTETTLVLRWFGMAWTLFAAGEPLEPVRDALRVQMELDVAEVVIDDDVLMEVVRAVGEGFAPHGVRSLME